MNNHHGIPADPHSKYIAASLLGILVVSIYIYWPGLHGPFLFDDFANINSLGKYGGVEDFETLKLFILGNTSGPTGRPVAMLSFLINDVSWPSSAFSFKYTNLMFHLLNGMLIFLVTHNISLAITKNYNKSAFIALLGSAFWLFHPFNVSTVLYPVQRMAILATFFILAGLICYIYSRRLLSKSPLLAHLLMSLSLTAFTLLATLSKENGALLPLLAGVIEYVCLSPYSEKKPDPRWVLVFIAIPSLTIAVYIIYQPMLGDVASAYQIRDFTLYERAITQPRVLFDYLFYWAIPQAGSPGLLTQDFPLSTGILSPPTTLLSIAGILVMISAAIWCRLKYPLLSLAILFFFVGHLIESTLLPLELYFEHRNYLPAVFLFTPLIYLLLELTKTTTQRVFLSILLLTMPIKSTITLASIWGNKETLAYHWADLHPNSQRAQRYAALAAEDSNKPRLALSIVSQAKTLHPTWIATHLHWLSLMCKYSKINESYIEDAAGVMRSGSFSFRNTNLLSSSVQFIASQNCHGGSTDFAHQIIAALQANPYAKSSKGAQHQLSHIDGTISLLENDIEATTNSFIKSLGYAPRIETAMVQVSLLASAGHYALALEHLDYISSNIHIGNEIGSIDYRKEMALLRKTLEEDIKEAGKSTSINPVN